MRFLAIFLLIFTACGSPDTGGFSKNDQARFRSFYIELANYQQRFSKPTSVPADSIKAICNRHGFDQKGYDEAMSWYQANPEQWRKFYTDVLNTLDRQSAEKAKIRH